MTHDGVDEVKSLILSCLERSLSASGLSQVLPDDFDLRTEGLVDSFGFVRLLSDLEEHLGFEIDLGDLDPEQLTMFGALSRHIAALRASR